MVTAAWPNSVGGLQLLVATSPTTGVVGGIDRSQWAFWRNQAYSASANNVVSEFRQTSSVR